jgi:hypothetical protein
MLHWLHSLKLGTVPDWFAGPALILALLIFRKDRRTAERAQIDLVGIWVKRVSQPLDSAPTVTLNYCIRNGSSLPVYLSTLLLSVHASWQSKEGAYVSRRFGVSPTLSPSPWGSKHQPGGAVEPGDEWNGTCNANVVVPADARSLRVKASVHGATLMDNAGREWIVRPNKGSAKRWSSHRYHRLFTSNLGESQR